MNLGKALKMARTAKNLTYADVAERAHLSVGYISLIERNLRDPNFSTVVKIAEALDMPLCILLYLADETNAIEAIDPSLAEKLSFTALWCFAQPVTKRKVNLE